MEIKKQYLLAIETSCDETSISLFKNEKLISCLTWSQIKYFEKHGGVIPQLAGWLHVDKLPILLQELLDKNKFNWNEVQAVAYTSHPGLIGCLKIGETLAKTINLIHQIPLLKVNHLYGHIYASYFTGPIKFPALALLVSGGHTQLWYLPKPLTFELLGTTLDDALGETLDKIGRKLGYKYPAGPILEKLAKQGETQYKFNVYQKNDLNFSFSGLKTNASRLIDEVGATKINHHNFAYSLQETLFEHMKKKIQLALKYYDVKQIILAGGVAANQHLYQTIKSLNIPILVPPRKYCTDNSAMIGIFAYYFLQKNPLKL